MTKTQAKQLRKFIADLMDTSYAIEKIRDELEELYDERSDAFRESEKGEIAYEEFRDLGTAIEHIQMAVDELEGIEALNE